MKNRFCSRSFRFFYIAAVSLVFAALAIPYLTNNVWFDEAATALLILPRGFFGAFTYYDAPNNHLLYSGLLSVWVKFVPPEKGPEIVLRLPSFLFSLGAALVLLTGFRRRLIFEESLLAALLLASSHVFLSFSCQIRGYALTVFLSAVALSCFFRILQNPYGSAKLFGIYIITGALSIGVLPTNILLFASLSLYALIHFNLVPKKIFSKNVIGALMFFIGPLLGFLFYVLIGDRLIQNMHFADLISSFKHAAVLSAQIFYYLFKDLLFLLPFLIGGGILLFRGLFKDAGEDEKKEFWMAAVFFLFPFVLVGASRLTVFQRNLLVMLPAWFLGAVILLRRSVKFILRRFKRGNYKTVLKITAAAVVISAFITEARLARAYRSDRQEKKEQDVYYQYYNSPKFLPGRTAAAIKNFQREKKMIVITDESDLLSLKFYSIIREGPPVMFYRHIPLRVYERFKTDCDILLVSADSKGVENMLSFLEPRGETRRITLLKSSGFFSIYKKE
ncbi:MAG: hypothetical protein ABIH68_06060 [bacterium]